MSASTETMSQIGVAIFPAIAGFVMLSSGPPADPASLIVFCAIIGGLIGSYSGSMMQMLREDQFGSRQWVTLALRVSASWGFAVMVALVAAALAGQVSWVPAIVGHPYIVTAIAGMAGIVAPTAVYEITSRAKDFLKNWGKNGKR
jgi:hypothetical protein